MTNTTDSALAAELERLNDRATSGPWCAEQCGDKCDDPVLGIAYDADDDNCERPLSGWLDDFDTNGEVKEYYTEQIAGEWVACDGNSASANLDLVMWLRNHVPQILTALRTPTDATERSSENARLREALTPSGHTKAAYHGEFDFNITDTVFDPDAEEFIEVQRKIYVPWTTVKEIMAAILARAVLEPPTSTEGEG